jgi:hypothetical protein
MKTTHRCSGSLKAKSSIRYGRRWDNLKTGEYGWYLRLMRRDSEYNVYRPEITITILHCPFCGVELET